MVRKLLRMDVVVVVVLQLGVHVVHPVMHAVGVVSAHLGLDAVELVGVVQLHVVGMAIVVGVVGGWWWWCRCTT